LSKTPAFQTYAADYYMDTNDWTIEEMGIYQRLLLNQWVNGDLPSEPERLARIAGCSLKKFKKGFQTVSRKFIMLDTGRIQNERLEQTRKAQEEHREKLAISGRMGGLKTQEEKRKESSEASSEASSKNKPLQSSSSTSLKRDLKDYATFSEKWWQAYPSRNGKKVGKKESIIYLKSLKLSQEDQNLLLTATGNYSKSKIAIDGYAKDPVRFLKKDFWRDWIEPESIEAKQGEWFVK